MNTLSTFPCKGISSPVPSLQKQEQTWRKPCSALGQHILPVSSSSPTAAQIPFSYRDARAGQSSGHQHVRGSHTCTGAGAEEPEVLSPVSLSCRQVSNLPAAVKLLPCFPASPGTSSCLAAPSPSPAAETGLALQLSARAPSDSINPLSVSITKE